MATRRKYKPRAAPPADVENIAVVAPQGPPAAPPSPPGADDGNPLQRALAAQQHAEQLHHQHAARAHVGLPEPAISPEERQAIEAEIDAAPLTPWQRRFLKSHPSLTRQPYLDLVHHAIMVARHAGIKDDTAEMDHAILLGVMRSIEHHNQLRRLTSADARPTPENAQLHHDTSSAADELAREAEQHFAEHQPAPAAPPAARPPPPQRRTMPMSAPPSRDIPSVSGRSGLDNHLTRDEREVARSSWPHLPAAQAEYEYLKNKRRMVSMKADGRIQQG
jgi:hypothetical protein